MEKNRLKNRSENYFTKAWELYEEAFPQEERRSLESQVLVMNKERYHFDIMVDEKGFVGFLLWWNLDKYRYVDHFATVLHRRNEGLGKTILENFSKESDKPVLLEVELPNSSINKRRINFYTRIGYLLNEHYYEVPSSNEEEKPLQLLLMSYPEFVSIEETNRFVNESHPIIFAD